MIYNISVRFFLGDFMVLYYIYVKLMIWFFLPVNHILSIDMKMKFPNKLKNAQK